MCQMVHIFYATVFLLLGSAGKPIEQSGSPPSEASIGGDGKAGSTWQATIDLKIVYGPEVGFWEVRHNHGKSPELAAFSGFVSTNALAYANTGGSQVGRQSRGTPDRRCREDSWAEISEFEFLTKPVD